MRITKPRSLGLLHNSYSLQGGHYWVVKPVLFFELQAENAVVPEIEGWKQATSNLPPGQVLDEAQAKPSAEVLLAGSVFAPKGQVATEVAAGFSLGQLQKKLLVSGNRIWKKGWFNYSATSPAPFQNIPITWERSFGSKNDPENPLGQGALSEGPSGEILVALPNFEYESSRLTRPKQRIRPAGFGPIDVRWKPRTDSDRLFDQAYVDEQFPDLPEGIDFSRFNMAPEDQRTAQIKLGQEYSLFNLHEDLGVIAGKLPTLQPRAFVERGDEFTEIAVAPETLWFFPSSNLGALIFQGKCEIPQRYAQSCIDNVLLAYENAADQPREIEYYKEALALRTDSATAPRYALDESQLSPKVCPDEKDARRKEHARAVQQADEQQRAAWETLKADISAEHGIEIPDEQTPEPVDPRTVIAPEAVARQDYSLAPIMDFAEEKKTQASAHLDSGQTQIEALDTPDEIDAADIQQLAVQRATERNLGKKLTDAAAGQDLTSVDLEQLEQMELAALAANIEPQPISFRKASEAGGLLREVFLDLRAQGQPVCFRDLTGIDLSDLDLSGVDLTGSILECANLRGCNFAGANLQGTSMLGAAIDNTRFTKAQLSKSNLSWARGENTDFTEADFSLGATMFSTRLISANFTSANLIDVTTLKSSFTACDFDKATMQRTIANQTSFKGCSFKETEVSRGQFIDSAFDRALWLQADVQRAAFLNCRFQLAQIQESTFDRCQIAGDSWMTAANLESSSFKCSGLRSSQGTGISFQQARFEESDLAMVSMRGANFENAAFNNCLMNESNFDQGSFDTAKLLYCNFGSSSLRDSSFVDTNLYGSNVLLVDFTGANLGEANNLMPLKRKRLEDAS